TAGLLFETIEGDTTATGERADTNTIYQLASGTPYLVNGVLEYSGYNLTIRAAPDADIPPMIVQSAADDDASGQLFRLRGGSNLTLEGLYLSGRATGGGVNDRIVRINTDDATVRVIDCTLDGPAQSAFRVQGDGARIFVENSVITRTGRPTDPTNGRFIDNRGVSIDTLVVTNSTIYNSTHYFYRNSGDGMIGYGLIDNNTFYNSALDGFDFGPVRELTFTDNIVANCVFIGAEQDDGELDPRAQFAIDEALGELTDIVISNNNFYHEADLVNNLPDTSATGDTIVSLETIIFDSLSLAVIEAGGTAATNISEVLRFVNPPVLPTQFQDDWLSDTTSGSTVVSAMPWDMTGIDVYTPYTQNLGPDRFVVFHDFCYDGNSTSATAGTDGGPIGDINAGCDPVS
ncbi:MAG: right-handed parallel beta-helix repeat-containing protein, partial [Bacteroidota bacterium]